MSEFLVTRTDSGKNIDVHVGDMIVIRLDENATTGFLWQIDVGDSGVITYVGSDYRGRKDDAIGAGDVRSMTFEARSPGNCHVRLTRCQEWEPDQADDVFELVVRVRA